MLPVTKSREPTFHDPPPFFRHEGTSGKFGVRNSERGVGNSRTGGRSFCPSLEFHFPFELIEHVFQFDSADSRSRRWRRVTTSFETRRVGNRRGR